MKYLSYLYIINLKENMKKLLIILLIASGLYSCSYIPTNKQVSDPYVVVSIERFDGNLCRYDLETGYDNIGYKDDITIVDTIGKFSIGDSILLSAYKKINK